MPIDIVEVRKQRGDETWLLRNHRIQFDASSLCTTGWGALTVPDIATDLDVEFELDGNVARSVRRYAPLPVSTRRVLHTAGCQHPGLLLDKFAFRYADQSFAKPTLVAVEELNGRLENDAQHQAEFFSPLFDRCRRAIDETVARSGLTLPELSALYFSRALIESCGVTPQPVPA